MRSIIKRSNCPISYGLDFLGDKWILLIFRDMIFEKKSYFKDFLGSAEGVATNILTSRLKMLVEHEFITVEQDMNRKTMKKYRLTKKGKDLIPLLLELMIWSSKYGDFGLETVALLNYVESLNQNRSKVIQQILANLEDN